MKRLHLALALGVLVLGTSVASAQEVDPNSGQGLYNKYCSQCHGEDGTGYGIATRFLKPAPRDLTSGKYKIRRTPTGSLPLDEDLVRVVKVGLPYTAMPGFESLLNDKEIQDIVDYLKTFSPDFENPELTPEAFEIPAPPPYTEASVARGAELYVQTGCGACHGEIGYGDGLSAPTLKDDWGVHIRAADLSMPWTFRGGGTREDIYRTMSAGFNGTPMPGFHGALPPEDIWGIVDYMLSLSGGPPKDGNPEAPYDTVVESRALDAELDLSQGAALFEQAPKALFPIVGQIVEPGRNFFPSAMSVWVQAVHNEEEIAFRVSWHDMRAETVGANAPDLQVPLWDDQLEEIDWKTYPGGRPSADASSGDDGGDGGVWGDAEADGGDIWGDAADDDGGDIWGDAAADDDGGDLWGDAEVADDGGGDFWGEEEAGDGGDDFWGDDVGSAPAGPTLPKGPETEFNDAVALQFPLAMPAGVRKPYFLFGDAQNPVDVWFRDLGAEGATSYVGRGSAAITLSEGADDLASVAVYEKGVWSVVFKRPRKSTTSISFNEDTFVPLAVSVWDGFNRERGNKRGLTSWYNVYIAPLEKPDPVGPMVRAGAGVLGLELLVIALIRRRYKNGSGPTQNEEQSVG